MAVERPPTWSAELALCEGFGLAIRRLGDGLEKPFRGLCGIPGTGSARCHAGHSSPRQLAPSAVFFRNPESSRGTLFVKEFRSEGSHGKNPRNRDELRTRWDRRNRLVIFGFAFGGTLIHNLESISARSLRFEDAAHMGIDDELEVAGLGHTIAFV